MESRIRNIGKKHDILNVYPHKFRRAMATKAIDKGMLQIMCRFFIAQAPNLTDQSEMKKEKYQWLLMVVNATISTLHIKNLN